MDRQCRQRRAGRRARRAARRHPVLGDGDRHRTATPSSTPSSGSARTIVSATYDECWRTVEAHGPPRMRGRFVHPFDDDRVHRRQRHAGPRDSRGPARRGRDHRRRRRRRTSARRRRRRCSALQARHARSRRRTRNGGPAATSLRNGGPSCFDGWQASFVDGAGGKSVLPTMWPLLRTLSWTNRSSSRSTTSRAAMRLVADRVHVIAEGAAACAVAAALSGRVLGKDRRDRVRRQHRSSTFAALVGACRAES